MTALHWITPNPTPYNNHLFEAVAGCPDFDLTVHFLFGASDAHPWKSNPTGEFRTRTCKPGLDDQLLRTALGDRNAFFMLGGWNRLTVMALIQTLVLRRGRFGIWTDTPNLAAARPRLKSRLRDMWIRHVFRHAERILGTGSPALEALAKMGCPPEKLVNFPYFIDLDLFSPAGPLAVENDDEIVLLSSGRLVNREKGYDTALRALRQVKDALPSLRFRYRLAGTGPDEPALRKLAEELDLASAVEFTGWLEQSALPEFYRSGHVFLHPSPFEPFGNTVLEAMACGLVVVGSDRTAAVIDRVRDGLNGFIHAAGNPSDLASKILKAAARRSEFPTLGRLARETAETWPVSRGVEIVKDIVVRCPFPVSRFPFSVFRS